MGRALGSRAQLALAYESVYGTPPGSGYKLMPFVRQSLATKQPLINSDLLGLGRDPQAPVRDGITSDGNADVPVDVDGIGYWLKGLLGQPTTAGAQPATGSFVFSAQPAVNSTVSVAGNPFTFVASGATGNQVNIGASLSATVTALAAALNASVIAGVAASTYAASGGTTLNITHDTVSPVGNVVALAASATSNATPSGATMSGGANSHTFNSGVLSLPSMALEIGHPDVPFYDMFGGVMVESMKFSMQRTGNVNATVGLVAQGSNSGAASAAGTPTALVATRFGSFSGSVTRNGVALGSIVSADFMYANNLDPVEVIRADGKIDGIDPTIAAMTGQLVSRFSDSTLLDQAVAGGACSLEFAWTLSASLSLTWTAHSVFLPRPDRSIDGPGGVQVSFDWQAAKATSPARMATVVLVNGTTAY
jgi:hypothetical protein